MTARDIYMYLDYLTLYMRDDVEITNQELGKQRKVSSLRSFYKFLYKNGYIDSDPAALVDMPKRHQKPIIRLEIDEVARMLDMVESGELQTEHQKKRLKREEEDTKGGKTVNESVTFGTSCGFSENTDRSTLPCRYEFSKLAR